MKIAVDAMGGDYAPEEIVLGAVEAVKAYDFDVVLVGDEKKIRGVLTKYGAKESDRLSIVHGLADNAGKFIKCAYVHKMHLVIFKNENQNQAAFGSICEHLRVSEAQIKIGVDTASPLWYKSKARC